MLLLLLRVWPRFEPQPLTHEFLAVQYDAPAQAEGTRFASGRVLEDFQCLTGIQLNLTQHNHAQGLARTVRPDFPDEVSRAVAHEVCLTLEEIKAQGGRVDFVTGQPYAQRRAQAETAALHAQAKATHNYSRTAGPILEYMNSLSPRVYAPVQDNADNLISKVRDWNLPDNQRLLLLAALNEIRDDAQPVLFQTDTCERVFEAGYGLQNVPRPIRRQLLHGCLEADLESAHLRLAAHLWDLPTVRQILEAGVPIWGVLANQVGVELTPEVKAGLKKALYATLNGAGKPKIRDELRVALTPRQSTTFLNCPTTMQLLTARDAHIQRIVSQGGVGLPDGGWMGLENQRNAFKLISQQLMAYEQALVGACYSWVAQHRHAARILSPEHDGFSFEIRDPRMKDYVINGLQNVVKQRAEALGVSAVLKITDPQQAA